MRSESPKMFRPSFPKSTAPLLWSTIMSPSHFFPMDCSFSLPSTVVRYSTLIRTLLQSGESEDGLVTLESVFVETSYQPNEAQSAQFIICPNAYQLMPQESLYVYPIWILSSPLE